MKTIHPNGLKRLSKDSRDLRFGQLFKLPPLSELPDTFLVATPLVIKDQKETDYCTAFSSTSVSEDQEGVVLDPFYQFFKTKLIEGDPAEWGADLRQVALSFTKFGSLEAKDSPCTIDTPRSLVVDPKTWQSQDYDGKAAAHKKASFVFADDIKDRSTDYFDNLRRIIWYFRNDKQSLVLGTQWCMEWLGMAHGIVDVEGTPISGHAVKGMGWDTINSKLYLVLQLSSGVDVGDGGLFYLSREVVNNQEAYGAVCFTDIPKETLQQHQDQNIRYDLNPLFKFLIQVWRFIINFKRND